MNRLNTPRLLAALALVLPLAACLTRPAREAHPDLKLTAPVGAATAAEPAVTTAEWPQAMWWKTYADPTLDTLIDQALVASPDIGAAEARFNSAAAAIAAARAAAGPNLTGAGDASRQRLSDNGLFPPQLLGFNWYNQFDLGVQGSYTFDWWGLHRAQVRSAIDLKRAAQVERDAAGQTIASAVATEYFGYQADQARLTLALKSVDTTRRALEIAKQRVQAHLADPADEDHANLDVLSARDHMGDVITSEHMHLVALAALLGCAPAELPELPPRELPALTTQLPASASIDLIARRPDIIASRWRVEASGQDLEAARAGFMPNVSLNGLLGLSSRDLGKLLEIGSGDPSITGAIHLPIFDAGALRAGYSRSHAALELAVAEYHSAVLNAARDVNTQLELRDTAVKQLALRQEQLEAARQLQAKADQRLQRGVSDARPQLSATEQWLAAQEALIETNYQQLSADVALIHALGGGYVMDPTS
jgi:multidrug efflux system outer membrane protein